MRGFFVWLAFAVAAVSVTVLAQDPIRSPTNDYFTPRPTFTPATTFVSATNGQPTMISGVGPAVAPSSYTWNYTKPTQTVPAPGNQTLSQSLIKAGYGPSVSQLLPSGNGVQTPIGVDGAWAIKAPSVAVLCTIVLVLLGLATL
ncbi:hypothetical protein ACI68E_001116 [Malassezia pachydermatis]|uniref:Uncharacterized protein n=1 Tax=Malassezia pachydermatis TaxID=77020 RepID=A0A0M9VNB3_9BASI|nr:hypothetical protein Malapachy_1570 [Malassezia pachydermatis]KOS13142.1 hypothetical protein Malapachy_1570 [Malassezia pachydermatis]